ncbi:MAG: hypothetical protein JXB38_14970 [Anaerolineales bacterium]|nr:hypothetical protein [Anaerolineales bacterium]
MQQHPFYWFCQHGLKKARKTPKKLLVRPVQTIEKKQQLTPLPVTKIQNTACACSTN